MNPNRILFVGLLCLGSLVSGALVGLVVGGFGICAVSLSPGLLGGSAIIGSAFSASVALLWRKAWWVGALGFSLPALLGAALGVATKEWPRVLGIGVCVVASVVAALIDRYPGPRSLKR